MHTDAQSPGRTAKLHDSAFGIVDSLYNLKIEYVELTIDNFFACLSGQIEPGPGLCTRALAAKKNQNRKFLYLKLTIIDRIFINVGLIYLDWQVKISFIFGIFISDSKEAVLLDLFIIFC